MERKGTAIPGSRSVICERGSHAAMYDDGEKYFAALVPFVLQAHSG
jgi:hypothetical protein